MVTREYLALQDALVAWMCKLQEEDKERFVEIIASYKTFNVCPLGWVKYLQGLGFKIQYEAWHAEVAFETLISEQIDEQPDGSIFIRCLPGKKLGPNDEGGLRNQLYVQPKRLQVGDVLVVEGRVVDPPREGPEGSVLVCFQKGGRAFWVECKPETVFTFASKPN